MLSPEYFRKQAEALYAMAGKARVGDERLALLLQAMEFEARAVDAERGKIPPTYLIYSNNSRERKSSGT